MATKAKAKKVATPKEVRFIAVAFDRDTRDWVVSVDTTKMAAVDNVTLDNNDVDSSTVRVIKTTLPNVPKEQEEVDVPEIAVTFK